MPMQSIENKLCSLHAVLTGAPLVSPGLDITFGDRRLDVVKSLASIYGAHFDGVVERKELARRHLFEIRDRAQDSVRNISQFLDSTLISGTMDGVVYWLEHEIDWDEAGRPFVFGLDDSKVWVECPHCSIILQLNAALRTLHPTFCATSLAITKNSTFDATTIDAGEHVVFAIGNYSGGRSILLNSEGSKVKTFDARSGMNRCAAGHSCETEAWVDGDRFELVWFCSQEWRGAPGLDWARLLGFPVPPESNVGESSLERFPLAATDEGSEESASETLAQYQSTAQVLKAQIDCLSASIVSLETLAQLPDLLGTTTNFTRNYYRLLHNTTGPSHFIEHRDVVESTRTGIATALTDLHLHLGKTQSRLLAFVEGLSPPTSLKSWLDTLDWEQLGGDEGRIAKFGLIKARGGEGAGLCSSTLSRPENVQMLIELNKFLRANLGPSFYATSLAIMKNCRKGVHVHYSNFGDNAIMAFGDYFGGQTSVYNCETRGVETFDARSSIKRFNANHPHWTEPWTGGDRVVFVWYVTHGWRSAEEGAEWARFLGFPVPPVNCEAWASVEAQAYPSGRVEEAKAKVRELSAL